MATNETRFCTCLTPETASPATQKALAGHRAALADEYRWPVASVIQVRFLEGDPALQARVRLAAEEWTAPGLANLTLDFVSAGEASIRIAFRPGLGSWSHLGTFGQTIAQTEPTMNFGWLTLASSDDDLRSVVLHEFGHALGLIHEHQNPTQAIQWNEPAVIRDLSGPPNKWDLATIRRNVFDHYDPAKVTATAVDPLSIMMYPIPASWTLGGFSSGINRDLSARDRAFIRQCYP